MGRFLLLVAVAAALAACSDPSGGEAGADPSPPGTITTLEPLPAPPGGPPEGRLVADLRQSSRDVSYDRFQVWIGNGLATDLRPRSITYLDPRLSGPLPAGRLRTNPAGSERGYTLALPPRPDCAERRSAARVRVAEGDRTRTVPVTDEAEVVARYVASRCLELNVARVARISFADDVRVDRSTDPPTATLVLEAEPAGGAGAVRILGVTGTPVFTSAPGESWSIQRRLSGTGEGARVRLRTVPARCDPHVFAESGGATTFRVRVVVDGRSGDLLLPLGPAGARAALDYATSACGL